jgi:hypothetical protein
MYRTHLPTLSLLAICSCLGLYSTACDPGETPNVAPLAADSHEESAGAQEFSSGFDLDRKIDPKLEQVVDWAGLDLTTLTHHTYSSLEVFVISTVTDTLAITSASNGLLAPFPAGIPTLDDPVIADGVLIATTIRDLGDNIVGFGTEQEVLDSANALGETTFTLTLPDRGTLMLAQQEDFSIPFGEIEDMLASQEFIRTYDPPLVFTTTVPCSGTVIGGTEEFAGASGWMLEVDIVHEINLIDRTLDLTVLVLAGID